MTAPTKGGNKYGHFKNTNKTIKKELIELQTACTAIESSIYNLPIPEYYDGIKNYEKIKKQISTIAQILNSL